MRKGVASLLIIAFFSTMIFWFVTDIKPVKADSTIYIRADGSISPPNANITSADNITYTFSSDISDIIVVEKDNIVLDGLNHTTWGSLVGKGIDLSGRSNVTVKNLRIERNLYGIWLQSSTNNSINECHFADNVYGIWLQSSTNNMLSKNNVYAREMGISFLFASDNKLRNNSINESKYNLRIQGSIFLDFLNDVDNSNTADGKPIYYWISKRDLVVPLDAGYVVLVNCTNVTVRDLSLMNNWQGILLAFTKRSTIENNVVMNNTYGIELYESSNNSVYTNNLIRNKIGISLSSSLDNYVATNNIEDNEQGLRLLDAVDNYVFHNNLMENELEALLDNSSNFWDNGLEGNCWSGYNGTDSNYDGIGDTPYDVGANNRDNYPLMGKFSTFETNQTKNINIISNSTIKTFTYTEYDKTIKIHVSNSTPLQTFGFCRITIPHSLIDLSKLWVAVDGASPTYWNYTLHDNGTHRWLYFTYRHSTVEIVIAEDNTPPVMGEVIQIPEDLVYPDDEVEIYTTFADDLSGVAKATLNYTINNATWSIVDMVNIGGIAYRAIIPPQPYCTNITYWISVEDSVGNIITSKDLGYQNQYHVIPEYADSSLLCFFLMAIVTLLIVLFRLSNSRNKPSKVLIRNGKNRFS